MSDPSDARKAAAASRTLALLNEQADKARSELTKLRSDLAELQGGFEVSRVAQLLEANEQLVLAALRAETIAEAAVTDLGELTRSSQRDPLTDTPNRALMLDRLEHAIAAARRHRTRLAVLFVDLDHFKQINDTLGHAAGDEVLQLAARRLKSVVRDADTVSRHGGDEFLVLLAEVSRASDAAVVAEKMLTALAAPSQLGGQALRLGASLGIAVYPEDGDDTATLIARADAAMYRSKRRGRGGFAFHKSQPSVADPPEPSGRDAKAQAWHGPTLPAHAPLLGDLREANEQLVIAALSAQQLEARARETHHRQVAFLAMVAHELRNPLVPIRTAAELLARAQLDDTMLPRLHVIIMRQVRHMSRLIDDLLDGSRAGTGTFRLQSSAVEMAQILDLAVETCRPAMESRQQHLSVQMPQGPLVVNGDAMRLAQVFSNLLDNASKYTPRGGSISLTSSVHGDALAITVSDNGIGITAEALPRIFELFVQDERARVLHSGGLGIGLAVVRDLVEAHGGSVIGRSAGTDQGSEFVVKLPLVESAVAVPD